MSFNLDYLSALRFTKSSICSVEMTSLEMSFYLKSRKKRGLHRLFCKLFLARALRRAVESKTPPMPFSLVYMKEIRAVRIVLIFHEELQVSLW